MKKKNGFTLIEIIVTISLLALISTIILLSISSARQKHNEEAWVKLTSRIKSAASAYIEDSEGLKALVYGGTTIYIQVSDLINAGILDENYIVDPTDGINILNKDSVIYKKVKVFLNANDALEFVYPAYSGAYVTISPTRVIGYTNTALDYLSGVRLFNDNGIEVSNTSITNIQKTGGKIYTNNHTIVFSTPGEYTLTYIFNNVSYTRTYYVSVASGEVINPSDPEPLVNPDQVYTDPGIYTYVPVLDGNYTIRVYGAEGGNSGGNGGYVSGNVSLMTSDTLTIIVGGTPDTEGVGGYNGGGIGAYGGGGSSIVKLNDTNIIVAAGGGGGATGTAGGEGDSTGGAAVETDRDLETETTYTPTAGTSGTDGSGGGSGNKYNMCLTYNDVYDACATTTNTCSYGCGRCAALVLDHVVGELKVYRWVYYTCNCSSCFYGSPTTCAGGYIRGDCTSLGEEQTKPGNGGTSMTTSAVQNVTKTSGLKTGDGRVEIKLITEGSGS